jgi:hypothetical protein
VVTQLFIIKEPRLIYNLWKFTSGEAKNGTQIPLRSDSSRVLSATGFSKRITAKIIKREKDVDTGMSASFSTEKACPKKKMVIMVDKFVDEVIRRLIYNFHAIEKQCPALNTLLPLICESTSFKRGKMSSRIL